MNKIFLAALCCAGALTAAPVLVNSLALPGANLDTTGGTSANNGRLGYFSDIYFDNIRNEWWALSDRGPGGGTISYDTRAERFTINIDQNTGAISNFQLLETVKFTDASGNPFTGLAPNPTNVLGRSFDPEGIVVSPTSGNLFVSDEYGPSLKEFDRNGVLVRTFTTPANLIPRDASNTPNFASDATNVAGRTTNRGFEGLAMSPDGKFLYAMLQSATLSEGAGNGTVSRIVKFDVATGAAVAQFAYQLTSAGQGRGISALIALNDHEFLVLERNNRGVGVGATFATADKKVFKIDITGATDVTNIDLDANGAVYTKVTKSGTFADLAATGLPGLGNKIPEKLEGLAIGPRLADGSFFFLVGSDNDFSVTQNSNGVQFDVYFRFSDADPYASSIQCPIGTTSGCFFTTGGASTTLTGAYQLLPGMLMALRTSAADLPNYVAPYAVPEPSSLSLVVVGLAWVAARRRKQ